MSYSSNLNEVLINVGKTLNNIPINAITVEVGQYLVADNIERIHEQGKAVNGSKIGSYDTTRPLYVNPETSATKQGLIPTKGKNGQTKFKNGKLHKATYVNSYKELRKIQGKESGFVNLNYTSKLQSELNLVVKNNKADIGFISSYGGDLSENLEKKYGKKIWGVTQQNITDIKNIVIEEVVKHINKNL